jgi:hypothetical protein
MITGRDLVNALTLREFLKLCDKVDDKYGAVVVANTQAGCGGNNFQVASRKLEVKFDVIDVTRNESSIVVDVDLPSPINRVQVLL